MKDSLTVLMSVRNGGVHLHEAIESILQQTHADFRFLIIDDASSDGSIDAIERYARSDPRIRLVRNESNLGLGHNLHFGVATAESEWIARMDCDDIAYPNRFEEQLRFLRENPKIDVLGSFAHDIDERGNVVAERRVPVMESEIRRLVWTNPFIHPSVMMRRSSILKVGNYSASTPRRQDYELWFRCVRANLGLANLPIPLLQYRFTPNTFLRNGVAESARQMVIGLRGCRAVHANALAYIGVCIPFLQSLLPRRIRPFVRRLARTVDPRWHHNAP